MYMYPKNQIVSCGIHFCGSAAFLVQYRTGYMLCNDDATWRNGPAACCTTRVRDQHSRRLCSRASSSNMGKQYR